MDVIFSKMNVWVDKATYDEAEKLYFEKLAEGSSKSAPVKKSSLAEEVSKARERIKQSLENVGDLKLNSSGGNCTEVENRLKVFEDDFQFVKREIDQLKITISSIENVVNQLASKLSIAPPSQAGSSCQKADKPKPANDDDDGVDLFGSESEEEDEEAKKLREQRVAAYTAKKSKKPTLIAKSNIILDVKPWDDETDMQVMEKEVRKVAMDGLVWGASKLVPLAYGIKKLQISCVVEDEKVSVDDLQEKLQDIEDYVQSVDIAAFNKV